MVSGIDLFFSLFNNLAIFISLTALFGYSLQYQERSGPFLRQVIVGLLFGIFAIGCMYAKIPVHEGVIVDQRNAIVTLSGVYGGGLAAVISAAITSGFRVYLGGSGALAGAIGVCLAALAGILLNRVFGTLDRVAKAAAGAFVATLIILPGFLFVDDLQTGFALMKAMALPYGVAIFLGISLVGLLLNRQLQLFTFEKAYKQSEKRYREVVEGTSDLITSVNEHGEFTYVNKESENIFGISPQEIIGMSAFDFICPEDREETRKKFENAIKNRTPSIVLENRQINRNTGAVHDMLWTTTFQFDERGIFQGASGIAHDITDRKKREERIHIFNELINKSNDAIFLLLPETAEIIDVNSSACRHLGYAKEELLHVKITDIVSDFPDEKIWQEQMQKVRQRNALLIEAMYKKKDGLETSMETGITLTEYKDQEYVIAVARDLTERKILESRLDQAQKMEAIGRLAGGVAHDLNNLLTPIIGYTEILMLDGDIQADVRDKLRLIAKAGSGAKDLIRQLLAFSRKQVLEIRSIDINEVLSGFEKLIRRTIRENIEIKILKSADIAPMMADLGQIEQVIMNLTVNAADAMPDGGVITIETSLVELDENNVKSRLEIQPGTFVSLSVNDTGCGMDKDTQAQIFEPFFTTKGELGTGLGLATVYGIVKQHNGNIWVYSEPGKGTSFKVYFPAVVEHGPAQATSLQPAVRNLRGSETILLVEDNEDVSNAARDILERYGYSVLVAQSGEDALEKMAAFPDKVELLLTDVVMPKMNGRDLFSKLSTRYSTLKVLFMSGYTDNIIVHHGVLEEGVHFVQKPFDASTLAKKVRAVIDGEWSGGPAG